MRKLLIAGAAAAATLLATAGTASAATVILESDFEEVAVGAGSYVIVNSADGWTKGVGTAGIEVQNNVAGAPAANGGSKFVELDSNSNSSMFYTFGVGGSFQLSFLYSPRPGVGAGSNGITLFLNGNALNPPGEVTGAGGGGTNWTSHSVNFQANAGDIISFAATGSSDSYGGYLDNIKITSAVPEPATWAMMIVGFAGVGSMVRSNRRKQALSLA